MLKYNKTNFPDYTDTTGLVFAYDFNILVVFLVAPIGAKDVILIAW